MGYTSYQDSHEDTKAVWNIDDEILKIIKDIKVAFLLAMKDWKLEEAYWLLDLMITECDAKLTDTEQTEMEEAQKELEEQRIEFSRVGKAKVGEYYVKLRNLYKKINRLMKEHGTWFREMEDDVGL